jgi:hypothetical protein
VAGEKAVAETVFRQEIKHVRCGGTYLAHSKAEIVGEGEDCPVCTRVLAIYKGTHGLQNVASFGTPLAEELGLWVTTGKPGPVEPTSGEIPPGA